MKNPLLISLSLAALCSITTLTSASAQTATWDGGGGNDNFNTAANWVGDVAPTATTNTSYTFTGSTRLTPNMTGTSDYRASSITFDSAAGAFTILGAPATASSRFTLPTSGPLTVTQSSANNQQINAILLNAAANLVVEGSGAGSMTFGGIRQTTSGAGIVLNRNAIFLADFYSTNLTGTPSLTYTIGSSASANATFNSDPFAGLNPGGTRLIQLGANTGTVSGTMNIGTAFSTGGSVLVRSGFSGGGSALISGSGALTMENLSFDGNTDRTLQVNNTGGVTFNGTTNLGPGSGSRTITFNVGSNSTLTLAGAVTNNGSLAGALTKIGTGTLRLSNTNTYTGATLVSAGTLIVNGSLDSGSTVTVGVSGTLGGNGTINGATTIAGTLAPGNSPGTLTINNALTLNSTAALNWEIHVTDTTVGGGVNDLVTGVTNLTLDGTINFSLIGGTQITSTGTWRLFNYTGTLSNSTLDIGTLSLASGLSASINTATAGQVNLVVIPEPATWALLTASLMVVLTLRRRPRGIFSK